MRKKFIHFFVLFVLTGFFCFAANQVTTTYIANDGYMFEDGTHKVVVDCMFYMEGSDHWHSPDKTVYEKMIKGEKPFDNITAIIVTHNHGDHYRSDMVARYLSSFETTLIAPPQVIASLKQSRYFTPGRGTILTAPEVFYQGKEFNVGELKITALTLHHVGNNRSTQNMVAAIDFGGLTILHAGDANLDDLYDAEFPANDIVMLSYWQGFEIDVMAKINENIKSKHVIFKHAPYKTIDESIQKIKENYGKVSSHYSVFSDTFEAVQYYREGDLVKRKRRANSYINKSG